MEENVNGNHIQKAGLTAVCIVLWINMVHHHMLVVQQVKIDNDVATGLGGTAFPMLACRSANSYQY
jgi:hypothetical protein